MDFFTLFLPVIIALAASLKDWRAAEEKARARRLAGYRMDARLLRMNI